MLSRGQGALLVSPDEREVVAAEADALAGFDTSNGTIRFPIGKPLPGRIVARLCGPECADRLIGYLNFDRSKLSGAT